MADEETKQLLREILATQKQYLEHIRHMDERYSAEMRTYSAADEKYRSHLREVSAATIIRALALLGVVAILGYIVFFGLHTH